MISAELWDTDTDFNIKAELRILLVDMSSCYYLLFISEFVSFAIMKYDRRIINRD